MRLTRPRLCSLPPPPPVQENLTERVLTFGHRLVATGLIIASASGLAFVSYGCYEIYARNMAKKRLKEQEEAAVMASAKQ